MTHPTPAASAAQGAAGAAAPSGAARQAPTLRRRLPASTGPFVALVLLCVVLSIMSPSFLSWTNIFNIGQQVAILAVIAIGGTAVIVLGGIDLSVGAVLGLSGAVLGFLFVNTGLDIWAACLVALAVAAAAGAINGIMIEYGRLPAFIATLAMMSVARGLALVVLGGKPLSGYPDSFRNLSVHYVGGWVPMSLIIAVLLFLIAWAYFRWRPSGRALFAMGANYEVARLSGLPVRRLTIGVYTVAGLLAGVGGILMTARLGSAQPTAGTGYELDVIAAVVIGGASLAGGYGSIAGTAVGVMIIGVLRNGLNLLNVSSFWQQVIIGVVIATAVLVENLRQRRAARA
ncbi:ABC transporter permease [Cellulomonas xiejunii]|uniref:ABC transporter permease n=1 Tax=Cellulomonas xiejunii TaxID=2968083 RepID=A0ABY5KLK7_9CELL|nr:ABC transporter permease [Cellulomonas xiejunii]MCC2320945.1 ABC transporter permease [Cellulomonas xiejunii]UUI71225.1 ABC transporter permease [Cellulomonas xiejunii]